MDKFNIQEDEINRIIKLFYEAYYNGDRLKMYSYLDTDFQREVPLNYFLIHPDYYIDLGILIHINNIGIQRKKKIAFVEGIIQVRRKRREAVFILKYDFGGWKVSGEAFLNREFIF